MRWEWLDMQLDPGHNRTDIKISGWKPKFFKKAPINVKEGKIYKEMKCFFYKKSGQLENDCSKRKAWFEKKGINFISVRFESNLIVVPNNTWHLDSDATTHVSNITQRFLSIQP